MKRRTWRPLVTRTRARWWITHRVIPLGIAASMVGLLLYFLLQPFFHPRAYLLSASAEYPEAFLPAYTAPAEDLACLSVMQAKNLDDKSLISSPAELDTIQDQLNDLEFRSRDVLIVWISAQTLTRDGRVDLLRGNFDPSNIQAGRYPLTDLLNCIRACPARTKLILLDTGRIAHAPRLGIFADCSTHQIRRLVRETNDPTLWVMLSHSEFERSHAISDRRCSAFARFVGEGLQGLADKDQDRFVDLGELYPYVRDGVGQWVRSQSHGRSSQTPTLLWGGDPLTPTTAYPRLVPVAPRTEVEDAEQTADAADSSTGGPIRATAESQLRRYAPRAPSGRPAQALGRATALASSSAASGAAEETPSPGEAEAAQVSGDEVSGEGGLAEKTPPADSADQQALAAEAPATQADLIISASTEQLWDMAWSLYDRLGASAVLHPIEEAPHLWRALQNHLLDLERALQCGDPQRSAAATAELRRLVLQLDDLAAGRAPQRFQRHDLIVELAKWSETKTPGTPTVPAHSLAMEEQMARRLGVPLPAELAAVAASLDSLASQGARADFETWVAQLPPRFNRYVECRLARRLASRIDVAWPNLQLALRARRLGESVAAETLETGDWTRSRIEQADRLRLAGESNLLAPVHAEDSSIAVLTLQRAIAEYSQAALRNGQAVATQRLADEARFYLHDYLRWSIVSLAGTNASVFDPAEFSQLLRRLAQATELLDQPAAEKMPELRRVRLQLELSLDKLRARISGTKALASVGQSPIHQPLATAAVRLRLLDLCDPSYESSVDHAGPLPPDARYDRLERLQDLAGLYGESLGVLLGDSSSSDEQAAVVRAASRFANAKVGADDPWKACDELGQALQVFYQSVPSTLARLSTDNHDLTDPAQRSGKIRNLRLARRLLYQTHPWDIDRVQSAGPRHLLRHAQLYDQMVWLQGRLEVELDDSLASEREYLVDAAVAYARVAADIAWQPPVEPLERPPIDIKASQRVDLADRPDLETPIVVTSRHESPINVWLFVDYDPSTLEVSARDDEALYDQNRQSPSPGFVAEGDRRPPTFLLQPGEARDLWIRIARKAPSNADARIVVRAISQSFDARHDLTVELPRDPSIDLVVEGIPGAWQPSEAGLTLYPFPNRATTYTLSLVNSGSEGKEVDFEILQTENPRSVKLPSGAVSAETAQGLLARIGASTSVVKLEKLAVPAGGKPIAIPFAPPADKEPDDSAKQPEKPSEEPLAISDFLVAVITDRATGRRTMKPLRILTQRPGRYVAAHAEFDPTRRRVEVHVDAINPAALPPNGVWVTCEPERLETGETSPRSRATLRAPAVQTLLYVEVPPGAGPVFPIQVHVDGYQRVFRFEVPTHSTSRTIVPESNRVSVRILEPRDGTAFGPRATEIDVTLAIDVPRGLPADGESFVEVGVDADRDRELDGDEKLLVKSDRHVELLLDGLGVDGSLTIQTRVGDLRVTLPPSMLRDTRAGLIARVSLPGRQAWSEPVELIFDSEAPQMSRLQLAPGSDVVQGGELEVSVLASDRDLSGVAKVEAGFDLQRRGEFGEEPPPLAGSLQPDGRWIVKVPTAELKPGVYTVLTRATDQLGNQSDYLKVTVNVLSKDADAGMPALARVSGRVVYGKLGKKPVGGVTVRLIAKADEKAIQTTTDDGGAFAFERVAPGEYELAAEALIAGNRRTAKTELQAPAPPSVVEPVELILQTPR